MQEWRTWMEMKYAEAMAEVELIVRRIEGNQLPVDELVSQVERATRLLKLCRERLIQVESGVFEVLEHDKKSVFEGG